MVSHGFRFSPYNWASIKGNGIHTTIFRSPRELRLKVHFAKQITDECFKLERVQVQKIRAGFQFAEYIILLYKPFVHHIELNNWFHWLECLWLVRHLRAKAPKASTLVHFGEVDVKESVLRCPD